MPNIEHDRDAGQFPFKKGDDVQVKVRENRNSGNIVAKFEAECIGILGNYGRVGPNERAHLRLPWGRSESTFIRSTEAEFELLEDDEDEQ